MTDTAIRATTHTLALIIKNFRTGAAGPGIPHRPEVVSFSETDDTLFRHLNHVFPEVIGLIIIKVNRGPQFFSVQSHLIGQKVPGIRNRLFLEIITEREVSEHLKKGVMPGRTADIFEIIVLTPGPHTFLRCRRPIIIPCFQTDKGILKLIHARISKKQGRVIGWYQTGTFNFRVSLGAEIIQKFPANFVSSHQVLSPLVLTISLNNLGFPIM